MLLRLEFGYRYLLKKDVYIHYLYTGLRFEGKLRVKQGWDKSPYDYYIYMMRMCGRCSDTLVMKAI